MKGSFFIYIFLLIPCFGFSLTVGVCHVPPLAYVEQDQPKGFAIDILEEIARKEKWDLTYRFGEWSNLIIALENGDIDVLPGMVYTPERATVLDFNRVSIVSSWSTVYVAQHSDIGSILDLEERRISVVSDTDSYIGEYGIKNTLERLGVFTTYIEASNYAEAVKLLVDGKADAAVLDRFFAEIYNTQYPIVPTDIIFNPYRVHFAFSKSDKFNSGLYLQTIDKYLEEQISIPGSYFNVKKSFYLGERGIPWPVWLIYALMALGGILVVLLLFAFFLRRQVGKKTKALTEKNVAFYNAYKELEQRQKELSASKQELHLNNHELLRTNNELTTVYMELQKAYQDFGDAIGRFESLVEVLTKVGSNDIDERDFFGLFLSAALRIIPGADYGTVSLIIGNEWRFVASEGYNSEQLLAIGIPENNLRHIYEVKVIDSLYAHYDQEIDPTVRETLRKAVKPFKQSLLTPFLIDGKFLGTMSLDIDINSPATFTDDMKIVMNAFAKIASAFLAFKRQSITQGKFQKNIILSLVRALEYYDRYTRGHSERVANYASMIAERAGLDREEIRKIYWASLVHDVGKIYVPQLILNKASKLTEEEFFEIRQHPVKSFEILKETEGMDEIAHIVLFHHERWDGSGYPEQLKRDEIPLCSRIIAIADAYDAMTSERPYRNAIADNMAREELFKKRGTQFDPILTDIFLQIVDKDAREKTLNA
jgi:ABC-type amino acid transport substrate-binding protein